MFIRIFPALRQKKTFNQSLPYPDIFERIMTMKQWRIHKRLQDFRSRHTIFAEKKVQTLILAVFPVLISFLAELGQMGSITRMLEFLMERSGVCVFVVLISTALFWFLSLLLRRTWIAGLMQAAVYMGLSIGEYCKFRSSGNHLLFTDLFMLRNAGELTRFTTITISALLIACTLAAAGLVFLLWMCQVQIREKWHARCLKATAVGAVTVCSVAVPAFFMPLSTVLGIDTTYSYNTFSEEERFENNNLLGNLCVSFSQTVQSMVTEPEEYSPDTIEELLEESGPSPAADAVSPEEYPNVIFIMSETFADFRALENVGDIGGSYTVLDEIKAESDCGTAIVPTFGGGTVRTEFELMFGLPVKALGNPTIPHDLLESEDEAQNAFASIYHQLGYRTTYIHPYLSNFYGREETYAEYGFDSLIFLDDFTVEQHTFHDYVDDETVYRQASAVMDASSGPDYIYITSMQNHMPYVNDGSKDEFTYYLEGIQRSCQSLRDFLDQLSSRNEPTIVAFIGDHFPYFSPEDNIYQQAGINADNCTRLYEQTYLVWSNCGLEAGTAPAETISSFYLPHLVYRAAGLPENSFIQAFLDKMEEQPCYSVASDFSNNDRLLDMITYDRVCGEGYSSDEDILRPVPPAPVHEHPHRGQEIA